MTSLPPRQPQEELALAKLEARVRSLLLEYINEPTEEIVEDIVKAARKYSQELERINV